MTRVLRILISLQNQQHATAKLWQWKIRIFTTNNTIYTRVQAMLFAVTLTDYWRTKTENAQTEAIKMSTHHGYDSQSIQEEFLKGYL